MTLLAEIQEVMERTYDATGINLEDCLISSVRSRELAKAAELDSSDYWDWAYTFLRESKGRLYVAIYYAPELVSKLEREDPRECLSSRNVRELIAFLEEITHGIHAALWYQQGKLSVESETSACNLEVQAKVDVYLLLLRFCLLLAGSIDTNQVAWIKERLFEDENFNYEDDRLIRRYRAANWLAKRFVNQLEKIHGDSRITLIRDFQKAMLWDKWKLVQAIEASDSDVALSA
ncbi:MAG: hypothetical protein AAGA18_02440 [Verrucomicrobiota bacterium]